MMRIKNNDIPVSHRYEYSVIKTGKKIYNGEIKNSEITKTKDPFSYSVNSGFQQI